MSLSNCVNVVVASSVVKHAAAEQQRLCYGDLPRQMKPKHNSNPTLAFFTDFTLHSEPIAMDGEGRITPSSVHSALTLLQLLSCC